MRVGAVGIDMNPVGFPELWEVGSYVLIQGDETTLDTLESSDAGDQFGA